LTTDISYDATAIKRSALQALKDAYSGAPVTVVEGTPGTGDHRANVLNHQTLDLNHPLCGATDVTNPRVTDSQVDYIMNMENAQGAYQVPINNAQDKATALNRTDLIQAIGRGIGNTAAHEIAHHFLFLCCDMDADPQTDPAARGTFNATGCNASTDPSPWTDYWPTPRINMHWEPPALQALSQCLSKGWSDFHGQSCHY